MDEKMVSICGGGKRPLLALAEDGTLWKKTLEAWEEILFNETYRNYYPPVRFTAIGATDVDFVTAGTGEDGLPYVFRSILGGVWDMANLLGGSSLNGFVRAGGRVNEVLTDPKTRQVFLLCSNGELVTLPDCPKCVKIRQIADQGLMSGKIIQEDLRITLKDGSELTVPLRAAVQIRVSFSYAQNKARDGGRIIDLRKREMEDVYELLEELPRNQFVGFFCEYGIRSDEAAAYARRAGFTQAYSMGGTKPMFHQE